VEQVESVEFVGGFNERGGTEMRVAELSLAYRGVGFALKQNVVGQDSVRAR